MLVLFFPTLDAGYFMHFSTMTGKPMESALLESRTLYPKRKLQCLQFFYKMTGSYEDRLVIWVKMDDGTGAVRRMKKIQTFYGKNMQRACSRKTIFFKHLSKATAKLCIEANIHLYICLAAR